MDSSHVYSLFFFFSLSLSLSLSPACLPVVVIILRCNFSPQVVQRNYPCVNSANCPLERLYCCFPSLPLTSLHFITSTTSLSPFIPSPLSFSSPHFIFLLLIFPLIFFYFISPLPSSPLLLPSYSFFSLFPPSANFSHFLLFPHSFSHYLYSPLYSPLSLFY